MSDELDKILNDLFLEGAHYPKLDNAERHATEEITEPKAAINQLLLKARKEETIYWAKEEGGDNWHKKEMCDPYKDRIAELDKELNV